MSTVRYYSTDWCGYCKTEFPQVKQIAYKLGYKVERINVEQCPLKLKGKCDSIDAVPMVEVNGKIMSVPEFVKLNT